MPRQDIRNIAIVAHVDHGKTSLVDQLLRQSGSLGRGELDGELIMDSDPLERERGITILSKNCAIDYTDPRGGRFHINIVDTPGHADFSGEVERVLKMADGVLLLVDASDGVMPQTRYVLSKALEVGLEPIVVINKMDRPSARPKEVIEQVFNLLVDLGAEEHAMDFPTIFTSAKEGWACEDPANLPAAGAGDIHPLFEAIIRHVPAPQFDASAPLQALVTSLDYNDYVGRIGIGRVFAGTLRRAETVTVINRAGEHFDRQIGQVLRFEGLGRREVDAIEAGDLFAVVGLEQVDIGDTLADPDNPQPLATLSIDEPTLHMMFRANDGPFAGKDGRFVTSRHLRDRLLKELQSNVALRVEDRGDEFLVSGRGLLHLGILLENMRREGHELTVGKPEVILHKENGETLEPIERLVVDVAAEHLGAVMQMLGARRAEMLHMETRGSRTLAEFSIPARGLIGLRSRLLTATQGEAILHHRFWRYEAHRGLIGGRGTGVMVATGGGQVTAYALGKLADRGVMFVRPGEEVYEGQIVGECNKDRDISVNVVRTKKLSNIHASTKEATVTLKATRAMLLEGAMEYIESDELVELTPTAVRLRKRWLKENERKRNARRES